MSSHSNDKGYVFLLQNFSVPLLVGVVVAIIFANALPKTYDKIVHHTYEYFEPAGEKGDAKGDVKGEEKEPHVHEDGTSHDDDEDHTDEDHTEGAAGDHSGSHGGWEHYATLHFLINDLFMVIFFGIAAKEIAEACLPGGDLNPPSKAINPLLGTIGGVLGPIGVYLLLNAVMGQAKWAGGWGVPTATDIALAWLVARIIFGAKHSAVAFLLLLAIADDAIGLFIIAFQYPKQAPEFIYALLILPGMLIAFLLRWKNVRSWVPYIVFGGVFSWFGLFLAHLHPALALVPIVPFLPGPKRDEGLFQEQAGVEEHNPLDRFEHDLKLIVDFGLFFFAFANAGVAFQSINSLTWIVLLSLLFGKTLGIFVFSFVGSKVGFPLPSGMKYSHLLVAGIVAGLGLTVALFVAGEAFKGVDQGSAKMGALFSGGAAILAIVAAKVLGVKNSDAELKAD